MESVLPRREFDVLLCRRDDLELALHDAVVDLYAFGTPLLLRMRGYETACHALALVQGRIDRDLAAERALAKGADRVARPGGGGGTLTLPAATPQTIAE
jgi:hypothetical protein